MVTIDGCKLLVDHGEAHGGMAERGLALGTGVTADMNICGVAARV